MVIAVDDSDTGDDDDCDSVIAAATVDHEHQLRLAADDDELKALEEKAN